MTEFLNMYKLLNKEQRDRIFTKEQQEIIDREIGLLRIMENPSLAKKVSDVMGEEIYFKLREED